jgi:hypothetical protein
MLLTITCSAADATDLGYLLHKNPGALYEKALSFGVARVFYPEAVPERCTMALLVEVDPIGLVRGKGPSAPTLAQYVSDRPYAPSSFMSVALAECFGTAMGGRSKERPERVGEKMPLSATLHALDCDGGEALIRKLFEPLGYVVSVDRAAPLLDDRFPEWGAGNLYTVSVAAETTVQDLLTHLYVLIPVLDNAKHYAFGEDEMEKLVRRGEGWLSSHSEKDLIARRYLRYRKTLANEALARLAEIEGVRMRTRKPSLPRPARSRRRRRPFGPRRAKPLWKSPPGSTITGSPPYLRRSARRRARPRRASSTWAAARARRCLRCSRCRRRSRMSRGWMSRQSRCSGRPGTSMSSDGRPRAGPAVAVSGVAGVPRCPPRRIRHRAFAGGDRAPRC